MRASEFPTKINLFFRTETGKMVGRPAGILMRRVGAALVFFLLGVFLLGVDPPPSKAAALPDKATERLVAVGDVHGDFDDFCLILKRTGLVDDQNHWTGGNATLVQTGDLVDRGPKGLEAMDLLMSLEKEAATNGGRVVPLLGNHEVMNILGDLRYVTPKNYAAFADSDSEKRRTAAYQEYAAWYANRAKQLATIKQPALPAKEDGWMAEHPAGFLEYRAAFSPNGKYGKWVRHHAVVVEISGVIFLHGGISPNLISLQLEKINSQVREEIGEFDKTKQDLVSRKVILPFFTIREIAVAVQLELMAERASETPPDAEYHNRLVRLLGFNNWLCMRDDGPLWFRGYDQWSDEEGDQQIDKVLAPYNASHIVVAHTVQKMGHIRSRFGGKVFLIDTGMLSTYWQGGRASALEIHPDGKFTAQYLDGRDVLLEEKHPVSAGKAN
ncbi:MAG TPA: metallophosphoesterase [Candidatus Acidoferrum sp.]|nr:metallophosphoesterase [Candidatus Acidoferrum sp.]